MLWTCKYSDPRITTSALLLHCRVPGQRWYHLICFGRRCHYFEDGGCEHTDQLRTRLNDYGRKVTKLIPFGDGAPPKRFAKRSKEGRS
jgi:hypothetical protein